MIDRLRTLVDRLTDPLGMGAAAERGLSLDRETVAADLRDGRGDTGDAGGDECLVDRIESAAAGIDGLEFERSDDEVPVLRIED